MGRLMFYLSLENYISVCNNAFIPISASFLSFFFFEVYLRQMFIIIVTNIKSWRSEIQTWIYFNNPVLFLCIVLGKGFVLRS